MPETMPTVPRRVGFSPMRAQQQTRSPFTLKSKVIASSGAIWRASVTLPPLQADQGRRWRGFFTRLDGIIGEFYLGDPTAAAPAGTASGTANSISGSIGDVEVAATLNGTLLSGDYVSCNNRLYLVAEDTSGGTLKIWPPLSLRRF